MRNLTEIGVTKRASKLDSKVVRANLQAKEAAVDLALSTPTGLKKIAAALTNPVRKYLDYVPIARKVVVVEPIPDGMIAFFDADIEEFYGTKIGSDGASKFIVCKAIRTIVDEFELVVKPKIPYKELRVRKYKMLDRAKERMKQGLGLREDNLWFSAFHTASSLTNTVHTVAGALTQKILAKGFAEIEKHRLRVASLIMNPLGISGIRRWDRNQIDEVARIEIRQRGYLGNLWGANFFVSNIVANTNDIGHVYLLSDPQFLAWMPIRADAEVIPADRPDDILLGWVGYELLGMIVHNSRAVAMVNYDITGDV